MMEDFASEFCPHKDCQYWTSAIDKHCAAPTIRDRATVPCRELSALSVARVLAGCLASAKHHILELKQTVRDRDRTIAVLSWKDPAK